MPKFLEDALAKGAAAKGLKGRARDHYIYGAMNNIGAIKGNKITPKGEAMQAKHDADAKRGRLAGATESHSYNWRRSPRHTGRVR